MTRLMGALGVLVALGTVGFVRADGDKDALAIVDKAIKALGGEEKLAGAKAVAWKAVGTRKFGGNESQFTSQMTVQGLDQVRREIEGEFGGNKIKVVTVLSGNKGWRRRDDATTELDQDMLASEKRNAYLQLVPAMLVPLRGKSFKVETAGEDKVGDKAAVAIKATGPDGKDFTLYFDKASGLPVKQVATVTGFQGKEFTQETLFSEYKVFDGIKRATKLEIKRDGATVMDQEIIEFRVLGKVDPKTFAEPD
jgi:hypothetical protein